MRIVGAPIERHVEATEEIQALFVTLERQTLGQELDAFRSASLRHDGMARGMTESPIPGTETHRQRRTGPSQRRAVLVKECVEERQRNADSGSAQCAAQD